MIKNYQEQYQQIYDDIYFKKNKKKDKKSLDYYLEIIYKVFNEDKQGRKKYVTRRKDNYSL